jgi:lysophospholipid acyltransferase (LPLAT)-like uncharacterized protein
MRIVRRKIGSVVLPVLAPPTLRLLARTWKVDRLGEEHYETCMARPGRLATLWHGRMLLPIRAYQDHEVSVLVSPSDDGSLITSLLGRFGYGTVRGSSNKNPARAIREMLDVLQEGTTIVITPDGPRGPRHSINPGPAWMARATGFPILPCGLVADDAWHLKSWDHFTIPKPRARVAVVFGEPMFLGPETTDDEIRASTDELRARMIAAEERGFEHLGVEPDW